MTARRPSRSYRRLSYSISVHPLCAAFPGALPQLVLTNLAGGRFWQRAEFDQLGAFEMGQALAAEIDQLLRRGLLPRLEKDVRFGNFAPFFVGIGDDGGFEHRGMIIERLLDFNRRDVFTAGYHDVL